MAAAHAALADEWRAAAPVSAHSYAAFYRDSRALGPELAAWHRTPERQDWTRAIVHLARTLDRHAVVDVGCGLGHDLDALHAAGITHLCAVEPNAQMRPALAERFGFANVVDDVTRAPVELADFLLCIDVLEHLPDPETFVTALATRARVGCILVESTATHDLANPLHLRANRGWQPGRALERAGWELIDRQNRLRVWRRVETDPPPRASVLLFAYRDVAVTSLQACLALKEHGWRVLTKSGDALVCRSRSMAASRWWRDTGDDVLVMIDDDIIFDRLAVEEIVDLCRAGHAIIGAAYPVASGRHLAARMGKGETTLGPDLPPREITYAATGFLAIHRRVLDALVPTLPYCHPREQWGFWPFFQPLVVTDEDGEADYLSEDYAFCARARALGFAIWLARSVQVGHRKDIVLDVHNMGAIHALNGA